LWVKLRRAGYRRTVQGLYIVMKRMGIYERTPSKRKMYIAKEYEQMEYPGQRVQVDIKWVPQKCMSKELRDKGERYYQYTAIDEYTRIRYLWFSNEYNTYQTSIFVERLKKRLPFRIECIQTDNGLEFTNRLSWNQGMRNKKTMFEKKLESLGIKHKLIKPHTPRHNGKVERSHRKDQERFYYEKIFYSLEDLKNRAKYWIKEYNNFPMRPLKWLSPREKLLEYEQG